MSKCPDSPANLFQKGATVQTDAVVLLCTNQADVAQAFDTLAADLVRTVLIKPDAAQLRQALEVGAVRLVLFDFVEAKGDNAAAWFELVRLARQNALCAQSVMCVALGRMSYPVGAVQALRAGVADFLDLDDVAAFRVGLERVLNQSVQAPGLLKKERCRSVLLLSPRPGIGCTTLSVNLAYALQQAISNSSGKATPVEMQALERLPLHERTVLLDLGWPAGDGALYLGVGQAFDFVQASAERHRVDDTMLHTVLEQHGTGLNVLSMPTDSKVLAQLRAEDALGLIEYLGSRFGSMVIDGGGHPGLRLMADLEDQVDESWVVVNQDIGTLVSLAEMLERRREAGLQGKLSLIVNRFEPRCGLSADAIAERFQLPLRAVLPDCRQAHMASASKARLLSEENKNDSYTKEVMKLSRLLLPVQVGLDRRTTLWHALKSRLKK